MRARAQRDYNQLVAPADGTVLRRDGELGQFIAAGQTVLTLACCAPLRVSAEVDEEDIARVAVGQKVIMRTDALPSACSTARWQTSRPRAIRCRAAHRVRIRFIDPSASNAGPLRARYDDGRQPRRVAA
jgi:multidrug efflux pump subunit AcrA (membrane-fusion protein)